ncbi:MAG: RdgB/HAM1 family non-canonical purine NTP pyrophosphatase [Oscillospiraceae bacterium]|jgi:XTP/dITP diphosphohydrolase|nr:RdgB/HAM1 family non-canonical purine NTP pyrophosphatase [Oscillospiraceae bacterium]
MIISTAPRLILATRNNGKAREMSALLGGRFTLATLTEAGFDGVIEENGDTFAMNAAIKAETVCRALKLPVLADDSGLVVDALDGEPGVFSARYAGRHSNDAANNTLLLERLRGVPAPRTARFVCALALAKPGSPTIIAEGAREGEIGLEPDGVGGFGYDPLFYYEGISFARMSAEQKNRVSHRAAAVRNLAALLDAGADRSRSRR